MKTLAYLATLASFLFFPVIVFTQVDLNKGLMAYYPFSGNANDASGNGNNPIFNNATLTKDYYGQGNSAYHFNGVDNYMRIPNKSTLNPSNKISICAWIKPTGYYYGTCHGNSVIMKGDADYLAGNYLIRFDDALYTNVQNCNGQLPDTLHETYYGVINGLNPGQDTPYAQKNIWRSVVFTYDGSRARLYIDCNLILEQAEAGRTFSNTYDLFFGRLNNGQYPYWFNGDLDEVRIYNREINADEVKAYAFSCADEEPCSNWLYTPSDPSYVDIGNLNITGNQLTIEALINRTQPYDQGTGNNSDGDIVSKHTDPSNTNYLLRPNHAYITTTNGFFGTPDACDIELNKTYHVAMVYNGSSLKFYRNGFLLSKTSATGNLIQNNLNTFIGRYQDFIKENFIGYINEVRIWNVARSQPEIKQFISQPLPNPASQTGLLAYYTFDDLKNKQGNVQWDGTLVGNASINQTNPECSKFIADSCKSQQCNLKADFIYTQNTCNPKIFQFTNTTANADSVFWNFGNGQTDTSKSSVVQYTVYGNYNVMLVVKTTAGCLDTISKIITVNVQHDSAIITNDTTICKGSSIQLKAIAGLNYCWSPSTTLSDSSVRNPIATPDTSTTYYLTSLAVSNNLVVNGNFSAGNTGFSSGYGYQPPQNFNEGVYWIGTNPSVWNGGMSPCTDHTTGNGNMMMINGATQTNINVWKQTIAVLPNTNYAFSTWIQSVYPDNPAQLQFSINGKLIGNIFNAINTTCIWNEFYATWNSGNNTSATISIVNMNSIKQGNDFALDDISFSEYSYKQDSVVIKVLEPSFVDAGNDVSICKGSSTQLNATGAVRYNWNASPFLSDTTIANPIARPSTTTTFIVTGYNSAGCSDKDSVKVTVLASPVISLTNDTSVCAGTPVQLNAQSLGNNSYNWVPATALSNSNIANPVATPADTIEYFVTVTDANGCKATDSVTINIVPKPTVSTRNDTAICIGASVTLNTTSTNANSFSWTPQAGLNNANIQSPNANPQNTTLYKVTVGNGICSVKDSVLITVLALPVINGGIDTTLCGTGTAQLNATGGVSYTWTPSTSLSNPNIANPLATPAVTTKYIVTGRGNNTCANRDSVIVNVIPSPVFNVEPATTIICNGDSVLLTASGGDVYNWSPVQGLSSSSTAATQAHPQSTTTYNVTITNSICKETNTLSTNVTVNAKPAVIATKSNDIDCSNPQAQLNATGGTDYSWSPATYINDTKISNPVVNPPSDTWYSVTSTGENGCSATDSILVRSTIGSKGYYVPGAFTPNGDGLNDCFGVKYWGAPASFDMQVYNKWGLMVYHSKNVDECWDGTYKGKKQGSGTFVYMIRASSVCGQDDVFRKGTVVLIR